MKQNSKQMNHYFQEHNGNDRQTVTANCQSAVSHAIPEHESFK